MGPHKIKKYLQNATEFQPHTVINKIKLLSEDLVNFHQILINNLNKNVPKILKQEQSKPKIVYST